MRIFISSGAFVIGIGFIFFGIYLLKNRKDFDITLTEYRLIYFGIMGIIIGLLGWFNLVPWEK